MVLFTKENMGAYKPVPVVILPPVRSIDGPTSQEILGRIKVSWDPEISIAVITMVWIPVEKALDGIGMETINVVIHIECGGEAS